MARFRRVAVMCAEGHVKHGLTLLGLTSASSSWHKTHPAAGGWHGTRCSTMQPLHSTHQIEFGTSYMGECSQQVIELHNGGPSEARFDLSFGPASDMGAADGSGPAAAGGGSDDPHAAFLRLARARVRPASVRELRQIEQPRACVPVSAQHLAVLSCATAIVMHEGHGLAVGCWPPKVRHHLDWRKTLQAKAREEAHPVVRVSPLSGAVPPYGSMWLVATFSPPVDGRSKGFGAQEAEEEDAARIFDYVVQVGCAGAAYMLHSCAAHCKCLSRHWAWNTCTHCGLVHLVGSHALHLPAWPQIDLSGPAGARTLRAPIRGRALLPRLVPSPRQLHFGGVACGGWADQLVTLTNGCSELPLRVHATGGAPYFKVSSPSSLLAQCQGASKAGVPMFSIGTCRVTQPCVWPCCRPSLPPIRSIHLASCWSQVRPAQWWCATCPKPLAATRAPSASLLLLAAAAAGRPLCWQRQQWRRWAAAKGCERGQCTCLAAQMRSQRRSPSRGGHLCVQLLAAHTDWLIDSSNH